MNLQLLTEHLMWGDSKLVNLLKGLTEEEFHRPFTGASGNIHTKTAHIISVYEFFIKILEGQPYDRFPDLTDLPKDVLLARWESVIEVWPGFVEATPDAALYGLPLAGGQRVEAQHIFLDALLHTTHHRAQLLTFIRLLGKTTEEVSPKDTNLDYLMFLYLEHPEQIHPAVEAVAG